MENPKITPPISCETKALEKGKFVWPKLEVELGNGRYLARPIGRSDIPEVLRIYRTYYPHLRGSHRECLLGENFYLDQVVHSDQWEDHAKTRKYLFAVIEDAKSKCVSLVFGFEKDPYDSLIHLVAISGNSECKNSKKILQYAQYVDALMEQSGVDYLLSKMGVRHTVSQRLALGPLRMKLCGISPGETRRSYDGKTYFRDALVTFYKFYNGAERYSVALDDCHLLPELRAFWNQQNRK